MSLNKDALCLDFLSTRFSMSIFIVDYFTVTIQRCIGDIWSDCVYEIDFRDYL